MTRKAPAALFLAILCLYAVWPWLPGQRQPVRTVLVYGFSIVGEAFNEAVFPAFQAHWKARTGERVELVSSFGGSGTVTNQILLGVPAQVAIVALELDALKLQKAGLVTQEQRDALPHQGILNRTPFVILVRPGNPLNIRDFADLGRSGVKLVHPDPLTSGGAQWAILAEYGSALRTTGDPIQAHEQLKAIWGNVIAQAGSARAARTQFESGFGDALITYEQDILRDQRAGKLQGQIVYPPSTILSEHSVMIIPHNIQPQDRELVEALTQFLWTPEAQTLFADYGFRSVDESLNGAFATILHPFSVADLGGWPRAEKEIIQAQWKDSVLGELGR